MPEKKVPVTLLTGFLGAGKTTLLNAFLKLPESSGTLVLINEFGEADIDGAVLAATVSGGSRLYSLPNGCLCCDLQAGLAETLLQMLESPQLLPKAISRVIIETTGLANPAAILRPFAYDERIAQLASHPWTVTLASANGILAQLGRFREALAQVAMADELVLTKCDLFEESAVLAAEAALRHVNPGVAIHRTGQGIDHATSFAALLADSKTGSPVALPETDSKVLHSEGIETFSIRLDHPLDPDRFRDMLSFLILRHADRLLRMKGIVRFRSEHAPRLVNVVQDVHSAIALPDAQVSGAGSIVFIGVNLPEANIRADLASCQE